MSCARSSRRWKGRLLGDVLKRDVIEGEAAATARKRVHRATGRALRKKRTPSARITSDTEEKRV